MATLISVDGGAFVGKSSLVIPTLKTILQASGIETISSHEPSETPRGKVLQEHIYSRAKEGAQQNELAKLFNESRRIHLEDVVVPFMESHKSSPGVCLLDRYATSTMVFQGLEGGVSVDSLLQLETQTIENNIPAVSLILYFPEDKFDKVLQARRISGEQDVNRNKTIWHVADNEKQKQRHRFFKQLPDLYREHGLERNIVLIDATQHPLAIMKEVISEVIPNLSDIERYGRSIHEVEQDMHELLQQHYLEGNLSKIESNWKNQELLINSSENTEGKFHNS